MRSSVTVVHEMVSQLQPVDALEYAHRMQVLQWLNRADDVFRRVKPAVPPQHLVSYVVPVEPTDNSVLLVDHINAGLWLPPGGHVEVDEHPARTVGRRAHRREPVVRTWLPPGTSPEPGPRRVSPGAVVDTR